VAGEASGDMHGAHLVDAIKSLSPSISFSGLGGPKMKLSGVELYDDLTQIAVVGFWEVAKHYRDIKKAFNLIIKKIETTRPDAVILIDYPGFNLRLARELKKRNIQTIYYISPQVWAWKKNRVYFIQKYINKMLVIFEFEKDFYSKFGIDVQFVGHPLVDTIKIKTEKNDLLAAVSLPDNILTIGLLPGSRQKEVEVLLPVMLSAAEILKREFPSIQFLIIKAPSIEKSSIEKALGHSSLHYRIVERDIYDGINACDLCLVASGTATLEVAIMQKPMVIVYKTSLFTWLLAKVFVKIENIGLVNVVAGKRIVPECIQFQATGQRIAQELKEIFTDEVKIAEIKTELKKVKESLGESNASQRAAQEILNTLKH